jgi:hypothetical protein
MEFNDYEDWRSLFSKPKAKFDYIKIRLPGDKARRKELTSLRLKAGERYKSQRKMCDNTFTLHDPTVEELTTLSTTFPDLEINELEIAIDFYTKADSRDNATQWAFYRWLKQRMYPQQQRLMKQSCLRFNWCNQRRRRVRDRTLRMNGDGTYYFFSNNKHMHVKLYVKEKDQRRKLKNVPVRVEIHLYRGGCQDMNIHRLALLPDFIDRIRADLSPFFTIAKGIKPIRSRCRSKKESEVIAHKDQVEQEMKRVERGWSLYGAAFADLNDLSIVSNTEWKLDVGEALQVLRNKHLHIPEVEPEKVEHFKSLYDVERQAGACLELL